MFRALIAAAVLVGFQAMAADVTEGSVSYGGRGYSVLTGQTVGAGNNIFAAEAGFPGLDAEILHGASSTFDLGGRFTFNYGFEGITSQVHPELKLNLLTRVNLLRKPKFNLGLKFEPGFLMYFSNGTHFGIAMPVGLQVGIPTSSALTVALSFDVPVAILVGDGSTGLIPILFGAGVEYRLDRETLLTFRLSMGPGIFTVAGGGSEFVLNSMFGIALPM